VDIGTQLGTEQATIMIVAAVARKISCSSSSPGTSRRRPRLFSSAVVVAVVSSFLCCLIVVSLPGTICGCEARRRVAFQIPPPRRARGRGLQCTNTNAASATAFVSTNDNSSRCRFQQQQQQRRLQSSSSPLSDRDRRRRRFLTSLSATDKDDDEDRQEEGGGGEEYYRNPVTKVLSMFMNKKDDDGSESKKGGGEKEAKGDPVIDGIDFRGAPKLRNLDLETLARALDAELVESEWFVTGKVNPSYFDESFRFQDPDVKLDGIEAYARGVRTIFDQATSRAEILATVVNATVPNTITCTWRLSGKANIGPGLTLKPYIVYTDFTVDPASGLIVFQEDRFDLPQWDILLSALFPFVIGKITAPPAPPAPNRRGQVQLPPQVAKALGRK